MLRAHHHVLPHCKVVSVLVTALFSCYVVRLHSTVFHKHIWIIEPEAYSLQRRYRTEFGKRTGCKTHVYWQRDPALG